MSKELRRPLDRAATDRPAQGPTDRPDGAGIWACLLQDLCRLEHANMGLLATFDRSCQQTSIEGALNIPPQQLRAYETHAAALSPILSGANGSASLGAIWTIVDGQAEDEDQAGAFVIQWLRPQGLAYALFGVVAVADHRITYLSVGRRRDDGNFDRDDIGLFRSVLPCIQMTFHSLRHIASVRAEHRIWLSLLDELPTGVALLNGRREPIFINDYFRRAFADADSLKALLPQLCETRRREPGKAVAGHELPHLTATIEQCCVHVVPRASGRRPLSVIVQRLRQTGAGGHDEEPAFVLFVSDPDREVGFDHGGICHLYGLTPAEGRLAALLASGKHIESAATLLGISIHTARTHLKRIFSKTDTSSQSDLVRLVLSAPPPIRLA